MEVVNMNRGLTLLMGVLVLSLFYVSAVSAVVIHIPSKEVGLNKEFQLPIILRDANNIGSVDMVISYDPEVLEIINVKKGKDFKGLISSNTDQPGIIGLGIVSSSGFNGEGEVAVMTFKTLNAGSTQLNILSSNAYDATNHIDVKVEREEGEITVKKAGLSNALIIVGIIAILAVVLFVFYFSKLSKKNKKKKQQEKKG